MAKLGGLVLAGGASRRMGRDKAHLSVQGQSLTQIMVSKLRAAGCDTVMVSGPHGIADIYPGQGPLAGIHAAFAHMDDAEAMLIVPVDMPALCVRSLHALGETPGDAVLYKHQSLPLKLVLNDEIRCRLEDILATPDGDWSIRNFVRGLGAHMLDPEVLDRVELTNLNTPDDVKNWEKCREAET